MTLTNAQYLSVVYTQLGSRSDSVMRLVDDNKQPETVKVGRAIGQEVNPAFS